MLLKQVTAISARAGKRFPPPGVGGSAARGQQVFPLRCCPEATRAQLRQPLPPEDRLGDFPLELVERFAPGGLWPKVEMDSFVPEAGS